MDFSTPAGGSPRPRHPRRGWLANEHAILADVSRLRAALHVSVAVLASASVLRFLERHPFDSKGVRVLAGAGLLLVVYAGRRWLPWRGAPWWSTTWCTVVLLVWLGLVAAAPSFAWCAVPLAFVCLQELKFPAAAAAISLMVAAVAASWTSMGDTIDLTVVAGPLCVAGLVVTAFRALEKQARTRQELLEQLRATQAELADSQHQAGVTAERARLSRDLHDSVAQGLVSIHLLLQAAERDWETHPALARRHVEQADRAAGQGLDDVRRVVHDLAPPDLAGASSTTALVTALEEVVASTARHGDVAIELVVHGDPVPLPSEIAAAILRTARGALANVAEHSGARRATATLTYQPGSVTLDVVDDGSGFDPDDAAAPRDGRGRGLSGIRARVVALDGDLAVESAAGEGTALAASFPVPVAEGRR